MNNLFNPIFIINESILHIKNKSFNESNIRSMVFLIIICSISSTVNDQFLDDNFSINNI